MLENQPLNEPLNMNLVYRNLTPVSHPVYMQDIVEMQKHYCWLILTDKNGERYYAQEERAA